MISSQSSSQVLAFLPQVIQTEGSKERKMDLYSRLMRERIIILGDEIDDHMANVICAQLLVLDAEDPERDVLMYINSPGGSVFDGMAIYDAMQLVNCPIATFCFGQAASMASVLLLAGTKGKRYGLRNSRVMIHQSSGGTRGQATDIEIYTKELLRMEQMVNELMVIHTGQPLEKLIADQNRDNYMTAAEAVEYGILDYLV